MESTKIEATIRMNGGPQVHIDGDVSGSDIKWNNFAGKLLVINPRFSGDIYDYRHPCIRISPFTGNCGCKALHHPSGRWTEEQIYLVESLLVHKMNCSLIVGSDWVLGSMANIARTNGFTFTPTVHNPNYHGSEHLIQAFWKILDVSKYKNDVWDKTGLHNDQ